MVRCIIDVQDAEVTETEWAMSEPKKKLKIGVARGGGSPPGYQWNVCIIDLAYQEAMGFLNASQYRHFALQFKELATSSEPTQSQTVDIVAVEEFFEVRDKGGVLGGMNVRIFFGVEHGTRTIVVLGAIKKQNNGATPTGDKVRMRRRWRLYKQEITNT